MSWQRSLVDLADEPLIPMAMVRRFCRADEQDDPQLELLLPAAVTLAERDTRWQFEPAEYSIELQPGVLTVPLPKGPYVSAVLKTVDDQGAETLVDATSVKHDGKHPGTLTLPRITATHVKMLLAVRVGDWPMPKLQQVLVLTLVSHWFEHPEAATADGEIKETPLSYRHVVRSLDPMTDGVRIAGAT